MSALYESEYRDPEALYPLELLFLSACETAAGDQRAALGLAGVALRAGARSVVGSLWPISDVATSDLVARFYDGLKDPSVSRAVALQRAQQALLHGDLVAVSDNRKLAVVLDRGGRLSPYPGSAA